jgi:hypothetical protein
MAESVREMAIANTSLGGMAVQNGSCKEAIINYKSKTGTLAKVVQK